MSESKTQKVVRTSNSTWEVTTTTTVEVTSIDELLKLTGVQFQDKRPGLVPTAPKAGKGGITMTTEARGKGQAFLDAVKEAGEKGILVSAIAEKFGVGDARKLRGHILAAKAMEPALKSAHTDEGVRYTLAA